LNNNKENTFNASWKISEILGFEVFKTSGERLGVLSNVIATGSNDVWVVQYGYRETLIPALKNIITEVNVERKKIFVSLPKEFEKIFGTRTSYKPIFNDYIVYED
jgi:16S rRNA processing protein RimM